MHSIRRADPADSQSIARLISQLGHPVTEESLVASWPAWSGKGNVAFVAELDGVLSGLVTLHTMLVLHRPRPVGRITSLVVDSGARRRGIGRGLMAAAESWLVDAGCGIIEVTSNNRLAEAHAFYQKIGYEQTSLRFARVVG